MKKLSLLGLMFISTMALAQAPNQLSYQATIRNSGNELIKNQNVSSRFTVLKGSVSGTAVYSEIQTQSTNANGLLTSRIGAGTVVSGTFSTIDWSNDNYFIKTETDPNGGTNYSITNTSQLLSVPYALYAKTSGSSTPGPQGVPGIQGIQGPKGDKGDAGNAGAAGANGTAGFSILQGATAPSSGTGANGDSYIDTSNGDVYAKTSGAWAKTGNIKGIQGIQGLQGVKGDQGLQGLKGDQGIQGAKGDQGVKGDQGLQGVKGDQGFQGVKGDQGIQGTQGSQGIQGAKGDQGVKGDQGIPGVAGAVGAGFANGTAAAQVYLTGASPYSPQNPVAMNGDVTINASGTTAIGASKVTTDKINNAAVTVDKLSATGTKDSSTFLRGDGTWATPSGGGSANGLTMVTVNGNTTLNNVNQMVYITGNFAVTLPPNPSTGLMIYISTENKNATLDPGTKRFRQNGIDYPTSKITDFGKDNTTNGNSIGMILIYNGDKWFSF